jgi:hypothetical protein
MKTTLSAVRFHSSQLPIVRNVLGFETPSENYIFLGDRAVDLSDSDLLGPARGGSGSFSLDSSRFKEAKQEENDSALTFHSKEGA